jgi:hypothetical protein
MGVGVFVTDIKINESGNGITKTHLVRKLIASFCSTINDSDDRLLLVYREEFSKIRR